ncbi:MAG: SDR family oxidoreductase [Phycisphaeraceae bacterium]|nr:SDR family oxidoreductase [Phycisphaeraceae bacterium]
MSKRATAAREGMELHGKVALVTGGAKRVGRAIALKLAASGMDVAITYHRSDCEARNTLTEIRAMGRQAAGIRVDLAHPQAAMTVHRAFRKTFNRLDALVNNASIFAPSPLATITSKDFSRNMAVNALAPLLLIQKFAPMLAARADVNDPASLGRVVNFIDIHVMGQPLKGYVAYNASKAALEEITMTLAMELAPHVTVNALAPGVVAWADSYTPRQRAAYLRRVPLARPGTPDDAATAALFLIRDAHYCTGQIIRLDGGRFLT